MPTFCRHNRFIERCPICSLTLPGAEVQQATRAPRAKTGGARRSEPARRRRGEGVRVVRHERASADGYGYSAEALVLAAKRAHGAQVSLIGHDWADERYCDQELLDLKVHPSTRNGQVMVVYFLPFALAQYQGWTTICQTMWETDRLPDTWLRPDRHCMAAFPARTHAAAGEG